MELVHVVHGGIRHLEMQRLDEIEWIIVHGGIRHLEKHCIERQLVSLSSWRHTPFRNRIDHIETIDAEFMAAYAI